MLLSFKKLPKGQQKAKKQTICTRCLNPILKGEIYQKGTIIERVRNSNYISIAKVFFCYKNHINCYLPKKVYPFLWMDYSNKELTLDVLVSIYATRHGLSLNFKIYSNV